MVEYVTVWRDNEPTKLRWGIPVVRCKDCAKWHMNDYEDGKERGTCDEWTHLDGFSHVTPEDGFCAWGEAERPQKDMSC